MGFNFGKARLANQEDVQMTLRRERLESTQSLLEQMLSTWVLQMLSCLQRKMASLLVDISENLQVFQVHYMCVVIL